MSSAKPRRQCTGSVPSNTLVSSCPPPTTPCCGFALNQCSNALSTKRLPYHTVSPFLYVPFALNECPRVQPKGLSGPRAHQPRGSPTPSPSRPSPPHTLPFHSCTLIAHRWCVHVRRSSAGASSCSPSASNVHPISGTPCLSFSHCYPPPPPPVPLPLPLSPTLSCFLFFFIPARPRTKTFSRMRYSFNRRAGKVVTVQHLGGYVAPLPSIVNRRESNPKEFLLAKRSLLLLLLNSWMGGGCQC